MEFSAERLLKEAKSFHTKKHLGQHFLVDPEALRCIASALDTTASDTIVEVGPGIGFLTRLLVESSARIVAVDLDRQSIEQLEQMNLRNVELKHGDILRFDLNRLRFFKDQQNDETEVRRLKVVGNVPYQITGLILGHVLGELDHPSSWLNNIDVVVLTVQREVAKRMVAPAGSPDYSRVSILVSYYCDASIEMEVPPRAFFPPPEVTSAIVKLVPRKQPRVSVRNVRIFKQIIEAGFRQRRKMFRNALSFLALPQQAIDAIFRKLSLDPQVRAERLSLEQFAKLADAIDEHLTTHANH